MFVGVLGAGGPGTPDPPTGRTPHAAGPPPGALTVVFAGAGLSIVAYLVGATILLCLGIAATARFATDWTTRAGLLRIRHRTTTR